MFNKKSQASVYTEHGAIAYCDQIITASLLVIIIAVPLYFDVHLHSVFDLSKITVLYILTFAILATWSIRTIIITSRQAHCQQAPTLPGPVDNEQERLQSTFCAQNRSPSQLLKRPLIVPIIAFLLVSGLATACSINPYLSLVGTYKRYGGFISTTVYISMFFVIIHFIDKKRVGVLCNVIIATACFSSIYGISQHFGLDIYEWSTSFGFGIRATATFGHPAFFSAFLSMVVPLILIKIFSNQPEQDCQARSNFRCSSFLYMVILALVVVAFYYTKTRASFLGLLVSNIFFFSLIGKKSLLANKTKTVVTITIITGISIFFNVSDRTSVIGRFIDDVKPALSNSKESSPISDEFHEQSGIASKLEGSVFLRAFQYKTGLKIIYDYPILGIGPETLGMIYPQYLSKVYREAGEYRVFQNQNRIHNDFLDMAVSRGLLGVGVYIWFIFAYARMVWSGCKRAGGPDKILIIGLCAGCIAYFIQNQFSFGHIPILTLFWFLVAMSVIASPVTYTGSDRMKIPIMYSPGLTGSVSEHTMRRFGKYIFHGLVICLMILLITICLFRYKADIYFEHGRRALNKNEINEAIESYELAVKYNPLALNYCNVLNGIYLKMAETGVKQEKKNPAEELTNIFSREQTTIWFAKAIDGSEQIQKLYPNDYHSAFNLGQAYHLLSKMSPARLPVRTIGSNESHSSPDKFDGETGGGMDMSKDAIRHYTRATELHPFKFEFRNRLARLYAEKGEHENAIRELKEARDISPANQASYLNLAKVFINDRGQYENAENVLLEFIKKNPDKEVIDIYRLLSFICLKRAKWENVLDNSIKIMQINQDDLDAHKYAAMANLKLERYDDARKLFNRILKLTGDTKNTYNKYAKEMLETLSKKQ